VLFLSYLVRIERRWIAHETPSSVGSLILNKSFSYSEPTLGIELSHQNSFIGNFKFGFKIYLAKAEAAMKPLEILYWIRLGLGILAGFVSTAYTYAAGKIPPIPANTQFPAAYSDYTVAFNGASLAVLVYLISYYAIKARYITKVEKPTKIFTTGIGIYFLSWIVIWVLLYTVLSGFVAP
jgi:hypothetical protein